MPEKFVVFDEGFVTIVLIGLPSLCMWMCMLCRQIPTTETEYIHLSRWQCLNKISTVQFLSNVHSSFSLFRMDRLWSAWINQCQFLHSRLFGPYIAAKGYVYEFVEWDLSETHIQIHCSWWWLDWHLGFSLVDLSKYPTRALISWLSLWLGSLCQAQTDGIMWWYLFKAHSSLGCICRESITNETSL